MTRPLELAGTVSRQPIDRSEINGALLASMYFVRGEKSKTSLRVFEYAIKKNLAPAVVFLARVPLVDFN